MSSRPRSSLWRQEEGNVGHLMRLPAKKPVSVHLLFENCVNFALGFNAMNRENRHTNEILQPHFAHFHYKTYENPIVASISTYSATLLMG